VPGTHSLLELHDRVHAPKLEHVSNVAGHSPSEPQPLQMPPGDATAHVRAPPQWAFLKH
jgi:hypothetical protein